MRIIKRDGLAFPDLQNDYRCVVIRGLGGIAVPLMTSEEYCSYARSVDVVMAHDKVQGVLGNQGPKRAAFEFLAKFLGTSRATIERAVDAQAQFAALPQNLPNFEA